VTEGPCPDCDGSGTVTEAHWNPGDECLERVPVPCPTCNQPSYGNPDNIDLEKMRDREKDRPEDEDIDY
jgi:hypothetical protein